MPHYTQICTSTDLRTSPQYQISRQSVQCGAALIRDTHEERNRRKSPANVSKCPRYLHLGGHNAGNSNFKPALNCVPGSNPIKPTYFPAHSADTCFKFAVLTAAMVAQILPDTSKSVFCQTTCFTTTPNTAGNIGITVRLWRVRVMFIPPLPSQA